MAFDRPFNAAIGRYVLCFQPDPVPLLRLIANMLWPGGIILFHDIHEQTVKALPTVLKELKSHGFKVVHLVPKSQAASGGRVSIFKAILNPDPKQTPET